MMSNQYIEKIGVTKISDFKDHVKIGGDYLYERWDSVYAVIQYHIEEKYKFFLARPECNSQEDTIYWFTKPWKEESSPIQIGKIQDIELVDKYKLIFNETLNHYKEVLSGFSHASDEYKILKRAIQNIDDSNYIENFVFAIGEQVICCAWGMTILEKHKKNIDSIIIDVPPLPIKKYSIRFLVDKPATIDGNDYLRKPKGYVITSADIPHINIGEDYDFLEWDTNPDGYVVEGDKTFTAQIQNKENTNTIIVPDDDSENVKKESNNLIEKKPWYKRFWIWLTSILATLWHWFRKKGWKWLLLLLLLLLLIFLLKECSGGCNGIINDRDTAWIDGDDNVRNGEGGIYDPGNPYEGVPSPTGPGSGYEDLQPLLPDRPNKIQPIEGEPEIIPGNPSIIGNRLNILMENESKSILDLVRAFKNEYPGEEYKVVYYDDVVKRIQIEIPANEREKMKQNIPSQFSEFQVFVFDESLFEGSYIPNDPAYEEEQYWYLNAIEALSAWDITRGSKDITVAVVDNGFNLNHPEFKDKIVMPYNVWTHDKNIFPQEVDHGTHVAGIAIGNMDNETGIAGIAPLCTFMPIQVANKDGIMTTTSVLDGILYALYQGADVINVSLGQQFQGLDRYPEAEQRAIINNRFKEEERLWREVMRIAQKHNNATIVVAAGNDNVLAGVEALQRPELFVTVSAVSETISPIRKADFSNYGEYSTISAPGVDIYSSCQNGYESMSGTSMAAPIVSGAIALLKSVNEGLTTQQIICALQSTGKSVRDNVGNLLQIHKAIQKVQEGNLNDCEPQPSTGDVQVLLRWNNYNDLDLLCVDPNNDLICFKQPRVPSGGMLEIDMNVNARHSNQPIENIYWPQGQAPQGVYHVLISYYAQHESHINKTPYKVVVKYGGKEETFEGEIEYKQSREPLSICTFTLGDNQKQPSPPQQTEDPNRNAQRQRIRQQLEQRRNELQQELNDIDDQLRNM